jgi:hypothetical protein
MLTLRFLDFNESMALAVAISFLYMPLCGATSDVNVVR